MNGEMSNRFSEWTWGIGEGERDRESVYVGVYLGQAFPLNGIG